MASVRAARAPTECEARGRSRYGNREKEVATTELRKQMAFLRAWEPRVQPETSHCWPQTGPGKEAGRGILGGPGGREGRAWETGASPQKQWGLSWPLPRALKEGREPLACAREESGFYLKPGEGPLRARPVVSPHLTSSPGTGAGAGDRLQGSQGERRSRAPSLGEADRLGGAKGTVWSGRYSCPGLAERA